MKKLYSRVVVFAFAVCSIVLLCMFSSSAKTVKVSGGFTFNVTDGQARLITYSGTAENVNVPAKVSKAPVTEINYDAFWQHREIKTITLPDTITAIGQAAFNECTGLSKIVLPKKLASIGSGAFWFCTELREIVIYGDVSEIGENAFKGCHSELKVYAVENSYAHKFVEKLENVKLASTYITSISLNRNFSIGAGESKTLSCKTQPKDAYDKSVVFSSSNDKIVSVSKNGKIKAKALGKATVTAKAADGKVSAKVTITVNPARVENLRQTSGTLSSVSFAWNKAKGAKAYNIYKYNSSSKKWELLDSVTAQSYTIEKLKPSSSVMLRVRGCKAKGSKSGMGEYSELTAQTAKIAKLTSFKQSKKTVTSVTVKWTKLPLVSSYRVYKYDTAKKKWVTLTNTKKTSLTISNLEPNKTVKLSVKGIFLDGKNEIASNKLSLNAKTDSIKGVAALNQSAKTISSATIKWNKLDGTVGYRIYKYDTAKKKWNTLATVKTESYTLSMPHSSTAKLMVRSVFKIGAKEYLGTKQQIEVQSGKPMSVSPLTQSGKKLTEVSIKWAKLNEVASYRVYKYDTAKKKWVTLGDTKGTSYKVTKLEPSKEIRLMVRAVYTIGKKTVLGEKTTVTASTDSLKKLTGLKQTGETLTSVSFSWNAVTYAESYLVEKYNSEKNTWTTQTTKKTSHTLSSLAPSSTVTVRVKPAFNINGKTVYGASMQMSMSALKPGKVQGLKASEATSDSIKLSWSKVNSVYGYRIYTYNKETKEYTFCCETEKTSFTVSKLNPLCEYEFAVKAYVLDDSLIVESQEYSSSASAVTLPKAVEDFKVDEGRTTYGSLCGTWKSVENCVGYEIQYKAKSESSFKTVKALGNENSVEIKQLSSGTEYTLSIRSYAELDGKTYFSAWSKPVSFTTSLMPTTKEEAFKVFQKALNNTATKQDFMLYTTTTSTDHRCSSDNSKYEKLLHDSENPVSLSYFFKGGSDLTSGARLSDVIAFLTGSCALSDSDIEKLQIDYEPNGSGFTVSITLPKEQRNGVLSSALAPVPNWSKLEQDNSFTVKSVEYDAIVVTAKVQNDVISDMDVEMQYLAMVDDGSEEFTLGEKLENSYIFIW